MTASIDKLIIFLLKLRHMENKRGKFIVIDGTDGSGKTTQLELLKSKMISEGHEVEVADFPQYNTKSAGMVEEYLSGKYGSASEVGPYKASIFYAIDRFDASATINKWLDAGKIVLANRYTSASLGHQGGKISNPLEKKLFFNWLFDLEYKIFEIPRPDLTIILQVESEISFKLAKERKREDWEGKTKDIHEDDLNHLKNAEKTFLEMASNLPGFKLVKCTHKGEILSPEAIHFLVWLVSSQVIKNSKPLNRDFQAIGNIIGSNKQIVNNRDLILNEHSKNKKDSLPLEQAADSSTLQSSVASVMENKASSQTEIKESLVDLEKEKQTLSNNPKSLLVEILNDNARLPAKAHTGDAGYDLYSSDYYSIPAYGQALVSTGIKIKIPENSVALIWDKSGLANDGITTMGGVIDSSYRGEIKVIVKNLSEDIFNIVPQQKIAQLLIQDVYNLEIKEARIENDSKRNEAGFGSTGKF